MQYSKIGNFKIVYHTPFNTRTTVKKVTIKTTMLLNLNSTDVKKKKYRIRSLKGGMRRPSRRHEKHTSNKVY
jgi:hypothetical protein